MSKDLPPFFLSRKSPDLLRVRQPTGVIRFSADWSAGHPDAASEESAFDIFQDLIRLIGVRTKPPTNLQQITTMKTMTIRSFAHDRTLRDAFRARYSAEERTIEKIYDSCPVDFYDYLFDIYRANQSRPYTRSEIKSLIKRNKAFVLDRYMHSYEVWSLTGEGPRCPWDTALGAGVIVVKKEEWASWNKMSRENRLSAMRAFLYEYNEYINGNVFVVSLFGESCGGFIGHEAADDNAEDILRYVIRDFAKDHDIEISDISSGILCGVLSDEDWINRI